MDIFDAIAMVETQGGKNIQRGAAGEEGLYQIKKIFVDDVNRILKFTAFKYEDRFDPIKSKIMMKVFWEHYEADTNEKKARMFNGGPKGMKKKQTIEYWNKVRKLLWKKE